jgi:hypothetical protein
MLLNFLQKLKGVWGYDANEKAFIATGLSSQRNQTDGDPKKIAIQAPTDYYYLALYAQLISQLQQKDNYHVTAIGPIIYFPKAKLDLLYPIRILYAIINFHFLKRKWMRLYKAIGINQFFNMDSLALHKRPRLFFSAYKIWRGLKSKRDLLNLSINGIYCGDLIYDNYLRFMVKPTVSINSLNLLMEIYDGICVIESTEKTAKENRFLNYFASYSTYIHHGIPIRVFLKHDICIYTSASLQQKFKKLSAADYLHTVSHKDYYQTFKTLDNQPEKIAMCLKLLDDRFKGVIDTATSYMKKSPYQKSADAEGTLGTKFDGIMFLHDFYDSPHAYSSMLFVDFYEWVKHTLDLIVKHNLNIGVKPHPNQTENSRRDIVRLKEQYPSLQWIDPHTSNHKIINSGITFGISIHGTILHELAYHGINPVCAGDNPHTSYGFVHYPKTIADYDKMIVNFSSLELPLDYREQVASFYYMHNIYHKDDFTLQNDVLTRYDLVGGSSELLVKVISVSQKKDAHPTGK